MYGISRLTQAWGRNVAGNLSPSLYRVKFIPPKKPATYLPQNIKRKEDERVKLKAFGIASKDRNVSAFMNTADYSDKNYDCVELRATKNNHPVLIMQSKKTAPLMWKVCFGFSQVYFRSFAEAVDFCNSRGMKIMKGQI